MGYQPYDSSGTDDDLPTSHQNRVPRGGHEVANERSALPGSVPYSTQLGENVMDVEIHKLEREAYRCVLRAFKAQADAITWDKEGLMTGLRKELRLSSEDHRELLTKVNKDDVIRRLREFRKATNAHSGVPTASRPGISGSNVSACHEKAKVNQLVPSHSFSGPSTPFHPHVTAPSKQPSLSGVKREIVMATKKKNSKSEQVPPGVSTVKSMHYSNPCTSSRGQFPSQTGPHASNAADAMTRDPLIGRKVRARARWSEDNNFYEASINNCNPREGSHALVYDSGTLKETRERVKLSEISPDDMQWEGEDPRVRRRGRETCDVRDHGFSRPVRSDNISFGASGGRGTSGAPKKYVKKGVPPCRDGIEMKVAMKDIRLLHTDTLLNEVVKMFSSGNLSPLEVERAKKVLRQHEKALEDAIAMISVGESGPSGPKKG
ncbi:hypothetical protein Dimus_023392 [Dionaea muscipula]